MSPRTRAYGEDDPRNMPHTWVETDRSVVKASRLIWFMIALNLAVICMLGYIIYTIVPQNVERVALLAERDQAIRERDQAFAARNQAIDERFVRLESMITEANQNFQRSATTSLAVENELRLVNQNQKRLNVQIGAQTDTFNALSTRTEELIDVLSE